jgi:hypothetical protein
MMKVIDDRTIGCLLEQDMYPIYFFVAEFSFAVIDLKEGHS